MCYLLIFDWLVKKRSKSLHLPLGLSFQNKMSSWRAVISTSEYINIFNVVQSSDWLFADTETEGLFVRRQAVCYCLRMGPLK